MKIQNYRKRRPSIQFSQYFAEYLLVIVHFILVPPDLTEESKVGKYNI